MLAHPKQTISVPIMKGIGTSESNSLSETVRPLDSKQSTRTRDLRSP